MSAFGDAFKAARAAGKKEFTFNGKKYHTRTADDEKKSKVTKSDIAAANETEDPIRTLNKDKNWTADDTFIRRPVKSGNEMKSENYLRRDWKKRQDEIERETIGADTEMKYKPRRPDITNLSMARRPGTNVNYENEDADTYKKGGVVKKVRGGGIAKRGIGKGRMC
jgi:hypothetical protein